MEFEPLSAADLTACARLMVEVFNEPPWNQQWQQNSALRRLTEVSRTPGFFGLKVRRDGMLAAFAAGVAESHDDGADFCVKELCVRDEHQRQGLGAAMLAELQRVLAANRVQRLYMLTPSEGPAADFCRKNGFCTNGEAIMVRKPLPHKD